MLNVLLLMLPLRACSYAGQEHFAFVFVLKRCLYHAIGRSYSMKEGPFPTARDFLVLGFGVCVWVA